MAYSLDIKLQARHHVVEEGRTPAESGDLLGPDGPVAQTVANWASTPDDDGLTWYDHREARARERFDEEVLETSPKAIARRLLERIHEILYAEDFNVKKADALSKLAKVLRSVTDARHQLAMLYQLLSDFVVYLRDHHADLLTPELTGALRDFKNDLRRRLLDEA